MTAGGESLVAESLPWATDDALRFRVLGPLEVWSDERPLVVGGPQQRALLALLLLHSGHVLSADRLVECLWSRQPPPTARGLLQGCVAGLRRVLPVDQGRQPLRTRSPGYLLELRPGELDLDRFDSLVRAARSVTDCSVAARERAAALLAEALDLWRGPALDGITLETCRAEATRLEERRLTVLEERIDIDLQLGRHADLVGELRAHVQAQPLRERLWAQLMLALHGADRQADALDAYQHLRQTLVEQLGIEPGETVRRLHQDILSGGSGLVGHRQIRPGRATDEAAPPTIGPSQLPASTGAFVGREGYVKRLDQLLAYDENAVPIGVISGMAGVGKTALAVHWAHRVRERFGDGQLYVDLHGYAPAPVVRPIEALTGLLQALGVLTKEIPVELGSAAGLYRSLLADKRVLVVLDNARSAEQVRPLLPGSPGCLVLVTSRDRLGGLVVRDGAAPIELDVLEPEEATTLLGRILGKERVLAEPEATAGLAGACALLPLALRIAAANLAFHPRRGIADQVADLCAGDRLAGLAVAGDEHSAAHATFGLSYAALEPEARRLFRMLALMPGPDLTAESAAALADLTREQAAKMLDRLADAHLLEPRMPGRYAFHDLLRLYAANRSRVEDPTEDRDAATERLFGAYLHTADAADRLLNPQRIRLPLPDSVCGLRLATLTDHAQASRWLDAERANLVALVLHAARHGPRPIAWLLAHTLKGYFELRMYSIDWQSVAEAGLAAAEDAGDLRGRAAGHLGLAARCERIGEFPQGITHNARALALARRAGWLEAESVALAELGMLHRHLGRLRTATGYYTEALEVARRTNSTSLVAGRLIGLGNIHAEAGELAQAADYYTQALPMIQESAHPAAEAVVLANLGECCLVLGRLDEALGHFGQALELNHEIGHRGHRADNLRALATAQLDSGHTTEALELARAAVVASQETGDRRYEADATNVLGSAYQRLSDFERAVDQHSQALRLSREIGARQHELTALIGLAHSHQHLGRPDEAIACAEHARTLACQHGYRLLEGPALTAVATIRLAQGRLDETIESAEEALAVHRDTGHRLGVARTLLVLGRAERNRGDDETASAHWRQALALFSELGLAEAAAVRRLLEESDLLA